MTHLLVDTSVVFKWFHADGEDEVVAARGILAAHERGDVDAHVIDLVLYEVGNVLLRALRWSGHDVADQLDDLQTIVGPPLSPEASTLREAARLAVEHSLSFYDATWAATARTLGIVLVSADRRLIAAGLAESATTTMRRLRLT